VNELIETKHKKIADARIVLGYQQNDRLMETISTVEFDLAISVTDVTCPVPCDHIPVRSWPLFRARQLMRDVIESLQGAKKS